MLKKFFFVTTTIVISLNSMDQQSPGTNKEKLDKTTQQFFAAINKKNIARKTHNQREELARSK